MEKHMKHESETGIYQFGVVTSGYKHSFRFIFHVIFHLILSHSGKFSISYSLNS